MWAIKQILILVVFVFLLESIAYSQVRKKQSWGLLVTPGIAYAKIPNGTFIFYPDPPFYVDLSITTNSYANLGGEFFVRKNLIQNLNLENGLGLSSYRFRVNYNYDRSKSTANNIYDERKLIFLNISERLLYSFHISKFQISPFVGAGLDYAIKHRAVYLNIINGEDRLRDLNYLQKETRLTWHWEIGLSLGMEINKRLDFNLRPTYRQVQRTYGDPSRRMYSYGISLGLVFKTPIK